MGPLESGSFDSFPERLPSLSNFQVFVPVEDGPAILAPIPVLPSIAEVRSDESQSSGHDDQGNLRDSIKTIEVSIHSKILITYPNFTYLGSSKCAAFQRY
jgi:hypothetical protein